MSEATSLTGRTHPAALAPPFAEEVELDRKLAAEATGTGFLLVAVVGSGILGARYAAGNTAVALLANSLATGAALFALIKWFAPFSGAHFNPLISAAMVLRGEMTTRVGVAYALAQTLGAVLGVALANLMFELPLFSIAAHARSGASQLLGEFVSTFGLVGAVWACSRRYPSSVAAVVSTYIGGAFWFTPTAFANPAVTVARTLTDTFSGIRPVDAPGFVFAEASGAVAAVLLGRWLLDEGSKTRAHPI